METKALRSQYYRRQAEAAHTSAAYVVDATVRVGFLKVAEQWESMAAALETKPGARSPDPA